MAVTMVTYTSEVCSSARAVQVFCTKRLSSMHQDVTGGSLTLREIKNQPCKDEKKMLSILFTAPRFSWADFSVRT